MCPFYHHFEVLIGTLEKPTEYILKSSSEVWEITCGGDNARQCHHTKFILKNHKNDNLAGSTPFWHAMKLLFVMDLTKSYLNSFYSYQYLEKYSILKIPTVYDVLEGSNSCAIALEKIDAVAMSIKDVNRSNIERFSRFLAGLHQQKVDRFGVIEPLQKDFDCIEDLTWHERLALTITTLAGGRNIDSTYVNKSLELLQAVRIKKIVPLMMDLRWDQFALKKGDLVGVFDLDAFVFAPIELDYVILEYLLPVEQVQYFYNEYFSITGQSIQITGEQRFVYRVLFYLMNALGETDFEKWMAQPELFVS